MQNNKKSKISRSISDTCMTQSYNNQWLHIFLSQSIHALNQLWALIFKFKQMSCMNINKGCNKLYRGKLTFLLGHKHVFCCILTCESVGIDLVLEPADHQSHFNILVNLTCMSLDYKTKPRGTKAWRTCKLHTGRPQPMLVFKPGTFLLWCHSANHSFISFEDKNKIFEEFSRNYSWKINVVDWHFRNLVCKQPHIYLYTPSHTAICQLILTLNSLKQQLLSSIAAK